MGYERLNLKTGQVITEEVFAHLEDGIEGAANAVLMTPILYADLVALRDAGKLKAGMFYRITDYVTTTVQENTQSAGHAFDVIVMATDSKTLSEEARAIVHEGDTYFTEAGANLAAWKVWYAIDNDSARFAWADAENGKGVIYRLIDEWGNDLPFDFKNILLGGRYTFDKDNNDESFSSCKGNQLKSLFLDTYTSVVQEMPYITFGAKCSYNIFGNSCTDHIFGDSCSYNTFGDSCTGNIFGDSCSYNTFGDSCTGNTFGNSCTDNIFGNSCTYNIFSSDAKHNIFEGDNQMIQVNLAYMSFCKFGKNLAYIDLQNDNTAAENQRVEKYVIQGNVTDRDNYETIVINVERNRNYETIVGRNSEGQIKNFCLADLAN